MTKAAPLWQLPNGMIDELELATNPSSSRSGIYDEKKPPYFNLPPSAATFLLTE